MNVDEIIMDEGEGFSPGYRYVDNSLSTGILQGLNNLRLEKKFFDMTICVGQDTFHCHRVVLASASQYFRSMFGGMMRESFTDRVTIFDVDSDIMEQLIEFCYTSEVLITTENVIHLLRASDLFEFPTIKSACCEFLKNHLQIANCINLQTFAEDMTYYDLAKKAMDFMKQNIIPITKNKEFYYLPFTKIHQLLESALLNVSKEEHAYEIALSWIKFDTENRSQYFTSLLKCIRLPFVRRIYLLNRIEMHPIMQKSKTCQELVKETKAFHACQIDRHENSCVRYQPRPSTGISEIFVVFGGCDENCDELAHMYYLNAHTGQWRYLAGTPNVLKGGYSATCVDNDIFVTGGSKNGEPSNQVWRYKSLLNEWVEVASMIYPREYHGSASIKSTFYVVSAGNCERYHMPTDTWHEISPMVENVNNCSVAPCCGKLYALGSQVAGRGRIIVQMYNPELDIWSVLPWELPESAFVPTIVSLDGVLYIFREDAKDVLAYNPTKDDWIYNITPMPQLHLGGTIAVHGGKLIVSGGYDNKFGLSAVVEAYDPATNLWHKYGVMPRPLFWQVSVSIFRFISAPTGGNFVAAPGIHTFNVDKKNLNSDALNA